MLLKRKNYASTFYRITCTVKYFILTLKTLYLSKIDD